MKDRDLYIDNKVCKLSVERFDENIDIEYGATYHGYSYHITGEGIKLHFKKYDDDETVGYLCKSIYANEFVETIIRSILNDHNIRAYSLDDLK